MDQPAKQLQRYPHIYQMSGFVKELSYYMHLDEKNITFKHISREKKINRIQSRSGEKSTVLFFLILNCTVKPLLMDIPQ